MFFFVTVSSVVSLHPFPLLLLLFFDFFKGISNFPSTLHLSHTLYNILNTDMRISVTKWWVVRNPYFHKEAGYVISFSQYILCVCVCLSVYMFVWLAMSPSPHPRYNNQGIYLRKLQHFVNKVWLNNTQLQTWMHTHVLPPHVMWTFPWGLLVLIKKEFSMRVLMRRLGAVSLTYTHMRVHTHSYIHKPPDALCNYIGLQQRE